VKHPADYYVRYLLAASWGDPENPLTLEAVNQTLGEMGLLSVKDTQWDYLLGTFQAPDDYLFNNHRHQPTIDFMKREKIFQIWSSDPDIQRILTEVLGDQGDRSYQHDLHILIMGNLPWEVIAEKISKKYYLTRSLTARMVEIYEHYFWRRKNLSKPEWQDFLAGHPLLDDYIAPLMAGEQQALFRAGMNPKYDHKQGLRDAYRQAAYRVQYMAFKPDDKKTADTYGKYVREMRALHGILGQGGEFEEQLKEARHWHMNHSETEITALADAVGPEGSYSGDGKSEKAADESQPQQPVEEGDPNVGNEDA